VTGLNSETLLFAGEITVSSQENFLIKTLRTIAQADASVAAQLIHPLSPSLLQPLVIHKDVTGSNAETLIIVGAITVSSQENFLIKTLRTIAIADASVNKKLFFNSNRLLVEVTFCRI
jgi:predicted DNA-binding ribbon-helix-helix protein